MTVRGFYHVVTQIFYFGRFSRTLLQNKVQLTVPIDKGYHPNYKERICVHIWRLRKEVTEIKGAEVASSHVGLVSLRTLPDKYSGTGDLVITSFGTNATGFLIGLIAHAKQMLCKTTVMIG